MRARDDMDAHEVAFHGFYRLRGGVGRGLDRGHVADDQRRDERIAELRDGARRVARWRL